MKTLVFDTCFNKSYIVMNIDGEIIANEQIESTDSNYHSAYLIPKIRDILKLNNIKISDLDAIGVNIGPGSFTGIRAGITIARVLAQQTNIKLVGITSLEILSKINETNSETIVILDARKNKLYFAKYSGNIEIIAPKLIDKDDIELYINKHSTIITDSVISQFLNEKNILSINYEQKDNRLGLILSEIVSERLLKNEDNYNWAKVKPLYIQKPSITKPKENKNE